jgi:hypothetical protein
MLSLLLDSLRHCMAALYLYQKYLLCWEYIQSHSHRRHFWNRHKTLKRCVNSAALLTSLSLYCHTNNYQVIWSVLQSCCCYCRTHTLWKGVARAPIYFYMFLKPSFLILTYTYYWENQVKEYETGKTCNTHGRVYSTHKRKRPHWRPRHRQASLCLIKHLA